jgi:hypothetical protein
MKSEMNKALVVMTAIAFSIAATSSIAHNKAPATKSSSKQSSRANKPFPYSDQVQVISISNGKIIKISKGIYELTAKVNAVTKVQLFQLIANEPKQLYQVFAGQNAQNYITNNSLNKSTDD